MDFSGEDGVSSENSEIFNTFSDHLLDVYNVANSVTNMQIRKIKPDEFEHLYRTLLQLVNDELNCEEKSLITTELMAYLQKAFEINNAAHSDLLTKSQQMPRFDFLQQLDLSIIHAVKLPQKPTTSGVFIFLQIILCSIKGNTVYDEMKSSTREYGDKAVWDETFFIPLPPDLNKDKACLKMQLIKVKTNESKMKNNLFLGRSYSRNGTKQIGEVIVPLNSISQCEKLLCYNFERSNKTTPQGTLEIKANFSAGEWKQRSTQEYRYLLESFALHELKQTQASEHPYSWHGNFSVEGAALLSQYSQLTGLSQHDLDFVQYNVYCNLQPEYRLSFGLFSTFLDKLIYTQKEFWGSTSRLLTSCIDAFKDLIMQNSIPHKTLSELLSTISKIFRKGSHGSYFMVDVYDTLNNVVRLKVNTVMNTIGCSVKIRSAKTRERKLLLLLKIIQYCTLDIQEAIDFFDHLFQENIGFPYARKLFSNYERRLSNLIEPVITAICKTFQPIIIPYVPAFELIESDFHIDAEQRLSEALLHILKEIRELIKLGRGLKVTDYGSVNFRIEMYHVWFTPAISNRLDVMIYKIAKLVMKAIELDKLQPVSSTIKWTTSTVDVIELLGQVIVFWQDLDWPKNGDSELLLVKLCTHICNCSLYYTEELIIHLDNFKSNTDDILEMSCYVINSLNHYAVEGLAQMMQQLQQGVHDIAPQTAEYIDNVQKELRTHIEELMKRVAMSISKPIYSLLNTICGEESSPQFVDEVLRYLEKSHRAIQSVLDDTNFQIVFDLIWVDATAFVHDMIEDCLQKQTPTSQYAKIQHAFHLMMHNFILVRCPVLTNLSYGQDLENIKHYLDLFSCDTSVLVHKYYTARFHEQITMTASTFGVLTTKCYFQKNDLLIEILNARNLVTPFKTPCNPFVRVEIVTATGEMLGENRTIKTKICNNTLFPLFDSKHGISLTPEQRRINDAVIVFSVIHSGGLLDLYIEIPLCKGFIRFRDIMDVTEAVSGRKMRIEMFLTRSLETHNEDFLRALQIRPDDKVARELAKLISTK